jgi:phosphoglycolate phosphatase
MNVLLDLDGTLTDPAPGFVNCIRFALDELGIECPSDAEVASHIGPPLEETLFHLLGASQASQIPEAVRLYRKRYATEGLFENAVYGGIVEALERIRSCDAKIVLATSKPRVFAEKILVHFNLARFFSGIYGSELDGTNSDKRDLLKHLLAQESLDPTDSVMVGDRLHDMRAAIANGVKPLGVLWGYGSLLELQESGAQEIIHEPNQLPGAVVI